MAKIELDITLDAKLRRKLGKKLGLEKPANDADVQEWILELVENAMIDLTMEEF